MAKTGRMEQAGIAYTVGGGSWVIVLGTAFGMPDVICGNATGYRIG